MINKLTIIGINLIDNSPIDLVIIGSNLNIIATQYSALEYIHINEWAITNAYEAGNKGMNAGAYLCEFLEEATGLNLS